MIRLANTFCNMYYSRSIILTAITLVIHATELVFPTFYMEPIVRTFPSFTQKWHIVIYLLMIQPDA